MKTSSRFLTGTFLIVVSLSTSLAAAGLVDTCFDPGSGTDGAVYAQAVQCDGKIVIGGNFATVGGAEHGYIARLNADGTVDSTFNPVLNYTVCAIAVQSDGKIWIGGYFTTVNGSTSYKYI